MFVVLEKPENFFFDLISRGDPALVSQKSCALLTESSDMYIFSISSLYFSLLTVTSCLDSNW